jgi:hypothetical protein
MMAIVGIFTFVLVLSSLYEGYKAFSCLENRCFCVAGKLIVCKTIIDQSLLDFPHSILKNYEGIVVSSDMDCKNVVKLERRTELKVINKDCGNDYSFLPVDLVERTHEARHTSLGHYIYETLTCILVILSLLCSAKLKHNMAPLVTKLPHEYTSNRTFIRNFFKVCVIIYY